ncbi:MAG: hypothetical protein QNK03_27515 [Myxococcota bacterium]|nr:hypothetical protein [Myxococcota bacterium]
MRNALVFAAALLLAWGAGAQYRLDLTFDAPGPPSNLPGVDYLGTDTESDVASAAGGSMTIDTIDFTQAFYFVDGREIDLRGDLTLSVRARIDAFTGLLGGYAVAVTDGDVEYSLYLTDTGVAMNVVRGMVGTGTFFAADTSVMRDYELSAAGGSDQSELRIDGALQGSGPASTTPLRDTVIVAFGDVVNAVSNATSVTDTIAVAVPEPGSTAGPLAALGALLGLRARCAA